MTPLTIFTWGYDGWGSSTEQWKKAADTVEQERGYSKPYFVDLRISRAVRAPGFKENAFEQTVRPARYRWMKSLGNRRILSRSGPPVQINDPGAVEELLGIALSRIKTGQRLIIFCSCRYPGPPGRSDSCHRVEVASLLLKTAAKRNVNLTISEWPGGKPKVVKRKISDQQAKNARSGSRNIFLGNRQPASLLGLPWCSIVHFESPQDSFSTIVDPPVFRGGKWLLPLGEVADREKPALMKKATSELREYGLGTRKSLNR